jgi:sugar lactone lactonase YvrE
MRTFILFLTALGVAQAPLHAQLPIITNQPASQAVWAGGNVTFAVGVSGSGPFTYQWQFNTVNLPNGIITTVAGNSTAGYSGDGGPAVNASLEPPTGVAVDAAGNLFIADYWNNWIRQVDTNGIITTVAGDDFYGYSGDGGPATNASLAAPFGVAVDTAGNLFIADTYNGRIREVNTNGIITTIAGDSGIFPAVAASDSDDSPADSGDGGPATNAWLDRPYGVAVDAAGNLFIADTYNYRICQVGTNGIITTVAGIGPGYPAYGSYSGNGGAAVNANLDYPYGVAVDAAGNLFIADSANNRVRKVTNTRGPALALNNVTAANAGNYQVVVTGPYGSVTSSVATLIVTSPPIYQVVLNSDGSVTLSFMSRSSSTNVVLCATNLMPPVVWQPLSTNVAGPDGNWQYTDTNVASYQMRFYRFFMQ